MGHDCRVIKITKILTFFNDQASLNSEVYVGYEVSIVALPCPEASENDTGIGFSREVCQVKGCICDN